MSVVYKNTGHSDLAEACLEQQLELASELGNKRIACLAHGNMGNLKMNFNRLEEARECYERTIELARDLGALQHEAIGCANLAGYFRATGELGCASEYVDLAVSLARKIGLTYYLPSFLATAADIHLADGDAERAIELVEEGLREAEAAAYEDEAHGLLLVKARAIPVVGRGDAEAIESAVSLAQRVLGSSGDARNQAEAHRVLYELTGENEHRLCAMGLYRDILDRHYQWHTAQLLLELEEAGD
jgi:tetratricopeptide (TPR) repeat protein